MLSAESATGSYPVDAVAMLAKIAATVEPTRRRVRVSELYQGIDLRARIRPEHLVALSVEACLEYGSPAAVVVPTLSGAAARRMALLRLPVWTIAVSPQEQTCQNLQFSSGIVPVHEPNDPEAWTDYVRNWVRQQHLSGEFVILTAGPSPKRPEGNHRVELIEL
jgi:pyruvate kinase